MRHYNIEKKYVFKFFLFFITSALIFSGENILKNCTASFCVFAFVNLGQHFQFFHPPTAGSKPVRQDKSKI